MTDWISNEHRVANDWYTVLTQPEDGSSVAQLEPQSNPSWGASSRDPTLRQLMSLE